MTSKRKLWIVGTVLAACAFAGGAYAATSGTSPRQAFLNDVAKRLHVTPQRLKAALEGATQDQLNAAVKAGRLTPAQANAIKKGLQRGALPPVPFFRRALLPPGLPLAVGPFAVAARYIGIRPAQLLKQLGSGESLARIATSHGKSVSGLENAMIAAERARLDRVRQRGLITQAQEQKLLSVLRARIGALVNHGGFAPRLRQLGAPRPFYGPRMVPPGFGPPPAPPVPLG